VIGVGLFHGWGFLLRVAANTLQNVGQLPYVKNGLILNLNRSVKYSAV